MNISVDLCFNILNLAVRVGLVAFLIKRYIVGRVQKLIFQEKQDLLDLKDQHAQLRESCNKISKQMQQDEVAFALLRAKFEIWHQKVKQQELQEKNACILRQQKIEILALQKIKHLQQRRFVAMQVPNLLCNVAQKLQKEFMNNKIFGKQYQIKLLDVLEKIH